MKMISWNVNGIRAAAKKGFLEYLDSSGADLMFVQETKATEDQLDEALTQPPGWGVSFHSGKRKGYSGVAVYWKLATVGEPDEVIHGLGVEKFDDEGRLISVRFGDLVVFGGYFPNGGKGVERE